MEYNYTNSFTEFNPKVPYYFRYPHIYDFQNRLLVCKANKYVRWYNWPRGSIEHESREGGKKLVIEPMQFSNFKEALEFYVNKLYGKYPWPFTTDIAGEGHCLNDWAVSFLQLAWWDCKVM
jgi:hypothetical protein